MVGARGLVLAVVLALVAPRAGSPWARPASRGQDQDALAKAFLEQGIRFDAARGLCAIAASVDLRDDLLEYLLVAPHGAAHESLFVTEVVPSRLNAALLALGAVPGTNARWSRKEPPPGEEELRAGAARFDVVPPQGDGFYLYAAWRKEGEVFLFRIEDLMRNLETGRSLRRHRFVFLGSRMVRLRPEKEGGEPREAFAADLEGNLVNLSWFEQGNTLLTAAPTECLSQTIWLPNAWLLPERGAGVTLVFARERLSTLPREIEEALPDER